MAFFSTEHTPTPRRSSLGSILSSALAKSIASWQRHRAERALEGLSYDTLKDIGFPSVDSANAKRPA